METKAKVITITPDGLVHKLFPKSERDYHIGLILQRVKENYPEKLKNFHSKGLITQATYLLVEEGEIVYLNTATDLEGVIFLPNDLTEEQANTMLSFLENHLEEKYLAVYDMQQVQEETFFEKVVNNWKNKNVYRMILLSQEKEITGQALLEKIENRSKKRK